jgi:hypothetical protein
VSSVAERLRSISSAAELHAVLEALATGRENRWTRTQIMYYLPAELASLATEYFSGENLRIPERRPIHLAAVRPIEIDLAVEQLRDVAGSYATSPPLPEFEPTPTLDELQAAPPEGDSDLIGHVLHALKDEAEVVDRESPKRYRLSDGKCVGPEGDQFRYVFSWSSEPDLLVPGELKASETLCSARVLRQAEGGKRFELLVDEYLGATVERAVFRVDPTFILREAFVRLQPFRKDHFPPQRLVADLFSSPHRHQVFPGSSVSPDLNALQNRAIQIARGTRLSYVWGPPGTGKTTSIARLIREASGSRERVLVVSPYNVAVDEAILATANRGNWGRGEIVRFGRVSERVRERRLDIDSLLEAVAENNGLLDRCRALHAAVSTKLDLDRPPPPTVRRCLEELGEIMIRLREAGQRDVADRIRQSVKLARTTFRAPEASLLASASVIGTTVALSFLSPLLRQLVFDHIVVDEASVLRIPEALLVSLREPKRLTFSGDPKQLPPIVQSGTERALRWIKPNPFDMAGISRPEHAQGSCVMLREQHRMAPPIRELVSLISYDGTLADGRCPASGRVVFLDTSHTGARATTSWVKMSRSRQNVLHRSVVASLLFALRERENAGSVLVLSPYLAQKRFYDNELGRTTLAGTRFATVHSSQGAESDTVLIDLVLAPGRGKSRFMDERLTPEFKNLMNVAMSRARKQLIFVGHAQYIRSTYPSGLLDRILGLVQERFEHVLLPGDMRLERVWRDYFGR